MAFLKRYLEWNNDEGKFWVRPKYLRYKEAKETYEKEEKIHLELLAVLLAAGESERNDYFVPKSHWLEICHERLVAARFLYQQALTFYRRNWNLCYHAVLLSTLFRQVHLPVEMWAHIWYFLKRSF